MTIAAVSSEWAKIRTVRSSNWSFAAFLALIVLLSAVPGYLLTTEYDNPGEAAQAGVDPVAAGYSGLPLALIALVVFSILAMTSEYTTGSIRSSLAAVPRRGVFFGSKVLAVAAVVTVLGTAGVFLSFFATQIAMGDYGTSIGEDGVLRTLGACVLYVTLMCLFSVGLAAVLRSSALAIGVLVPMLFMVSTILTAIPGIGRYAQFLPDQAGQRMFVRGPVGDDAVVTPEIGLLVLSAWSVCALVAGYWSVARRDV